MSEAHIDIRLRPVRVGLLVRPTDRKSIITFMRACSCVWGGIYNPIIPVFRRFPSNWKREAFEKYKPTDVSRGYIRFFEPDVYVTPDLGLLNEAGLSSLNEKSYMEQRAIELEKFVAPHDEKEWVETQFGVDIIDVIGDLYKSEHKFRQRQERDSYIVKPHATEGLVETVFGLYPQDDTARYIRDNYIDAFSSQAKEPTPQAWIDVFKNNAIVPLYLTQHALEKTRYWYHQPVIYIFDPDHSIDLIDAWNIRLEPSPVLPVPIEWARELASEFREIVIAEHRPVRGNPSGLMHSATVEFARSISESDRKAIITAISDGLPQGVTFSVKNWRNRVWAWPSDGVRPRAELLSVIASERNVVSPINKTSARFETISPRFAARYGAASVRWVNAVTVSRYGPTELATLLPFNTFDKTWPRIGATRDVPNIGAEGWVFHQRYKNSSEAINFLTPDNAIIEFLDRRGIKAELSEPGQIAKQIIDQLGGLLGCRILADLETLEFINNMAGGIRRKSNADNEVEETFEGRRAPIKKWSDLVSRRNERLFGRVTLEDFTANNIIRLGVTSKCPQCLFENWHGLNIVDYRITCDRCLKPYEFPQAQIQKNNKNWDYRVIGPFSITDYAKGSYAAILALRVLSQFSTSDVHMTFATAMKLRFDGKEAESDFIGWHVKGMLGRDRFRDPQFFVGEAKSKGEGDLIKEKDLEKLKLLGAKIPGCVIVIAIMRNNFTETEIARLEKFVIWASNPDQFGHERNPVLLLTGHELFADYGVQSVWEKLGGAYKARADFHNLKSLYDFARSTREIYVPKAVEVLRIRRENKFAKLRKQAVVVGPQSKTGS